MHSAARVLTLAAAVALPMYAHAQSASEADAKKIEEGLVKVLPDGLTRDGGLTVRAAGDAYELKLDLNGAIARTIAPWTVREVTPIIQNLTPKDGGLWELTSKSSFKLATEFAAANRSNSMQFTIGEYDTLGNFDPGISFLRDADIRFKDVLLNMRASQDNIKFGVKDYTTKLDVTDLRPGVGDLTSDFTMTELKETFGSFPSPEVKIVGATLAGQQKFEAVDFAGFKKLIAFWQGSARGKRIADLSKSERTDLASIVAAHRPFIKRAGEKTSIGNVSISSGTKQFQIENVDYSWTFEDIDKEPSLVLSAKVLKPSVSPGFWPAGLEKALPEEVSISVRQSGLKMQPFWEVLSNPDADPNIDFRTLTQSENYKYDFPEIFVRSKHYDLSVSGTFLPSPSSRGRYEVDVMVTAKNFDKTLKFLEEMSKTVPQFSQVVFFASMAKGMGKTQTDGSMVWQVKSDSKGKITINGQPLPV